MTSERFNDIDLLSTEKVRAEKIDLGDFVDEYLTVDVINRRIMLHWVYDDMKYWRKQGSQKSGRAVKKLRVMETYTKKIVTNYACFYSTTILTTKIIKETRKVCFNSILVYYEDAVMTKTPPPVALFWKVRRAIHRVLWRPCLPYQQSSRCIIRQDVCVQQSHAEKHINYHNLKWTLEGLLPCCCYTIKTNIRTILSQVWQPASAGKGADMSRDVVLKKRRGNGPHQVKRKTAPNSSNKVSIHLQEFLQLMFMFHCRLLPSSANLRVANTSVRSQLYLM